VRAARLLGHQHQTLGSLAAIAEGPAAICLSRGGAAKTYTYTEPNEDAACFAIGAGGTLVAVADGHFGARGAERAVEWLLEGPAAQWTAETSPASSAAEWREELANSLQRIHLALIEKDRSLGLEPAPTTLSMAVARPLENLVVHASVGDSPLFLATSDSARNVGWSREDVPGCAFLGERYEGDVLQEWQFVVGSEPIAGLDAILIASDGLCEEGIGVSDAAAAAAAAAAHGAGFDPELRPLETSKHLSETALQAQRENRSGDNVGTAIAWIGATANSSLD